MNAYKLFWGDCAKLQALNYSAFFLQTLGVHRSVRRLCTQNTHVLLPHNFDWLKLPFSQAGGTSVFNPTPLLQNTENICRGSSYFVNVLLNAPQQSVHHLRGSIQCIFLQALIIARDVRAVFFIWLSNHQNPICNIFLLVKVGSGLTRALTSVRVLSLCWEANQAFFFSLCN